MDGEATRSTWRRPAEEVFGGAIGGRGDKAPGHFIKRVPAKKPDLGGWPLEMGTEQLKDHLDQARADDLG
jgi:hypothetical protein